MKHESIQRSVSQGLLALVLTAFVTVAAAAPLPQQSEAPRPAAKPTAKGVQEIPPPRGRLPAYYGKVVSDQQRQQIYTIQAKYQERIDELTKELTTLTEKRNVEVEKVLSDEQRAEIAKLKEARKPSSRSDADDKVAVDQQ